MSRRVCVCLDVYGDMSRPVGDVSKRYGYIQEAIALSKRRFQPNLSFKQAAALHATRHAPRIEALHVERRLLGRREALGTAGHALDHLHPGEGGLGFVRGDILSF